MNTYETQEFFGDIKDSYEIQVLCDALNGKGKQDYSALIKKASIEFEKVQRKIFIERGLKLFKNLLTFSENNSRLSIKDEAMNQVRLYLREEVEKVLRKYGKDTSELNWNKLK